MNSDDVLDYLDRIAAEPGKIKKQEMVAAGLKDPLFRATAIYAYDPFRTFGVAGFAPAGDVHRTFEELPALLDDLAARRLTGGAAARALSDWADRHSRKSQDLLRRILKKDLRAGFTEGTVNRAEPDTIRVFKVMLSKDYDEKRVKSFPVAAEPKNDGLRSACMIANGDAVFLSRAGQVQTACEHVVPSVLAFLEAAGVGGSFMLDGEMTTGGFQKSSGDVRRKKTADPNTAAFTYTVFDAMPHEEFEGHVKMPYRERRARLERMFAAQPPALKHLRLGRQRLLHSFAEIDAYYEENRADGEEGSIVKDLDAPYEQKRSYAWMKMKPEQTEDLIVVDAYEGEGGTKYQGMLGGLTVERKGFRVNVGGGFSDAQRRDLWKTYLDHGTAEGPLIGRMIEVEFMEETDGGRSLRHPRFKVFRDDKHVPG